MTYFVLNYDSLAILGVKSGCLVPSQGTIVLYSYA